MLYAKDIKPIPKYIEKKIRALDMKMHEQNAHTRFYAYLTEQKGVLVKVSVAVKTYKKQWYCKQVAVHGLHEERCLAKDICCSYVGGFFADWHEELGVNNYYMEHSWTDEPNRLWNPWAPIVNIGYLARYPQYRYSGYDKADHRFMLQFLMRYEEYPQIEYLMKLGLTELWTSKRICVMLAKDKAFRKWIVSHRDALALHYYNATVIINAYRRGRSLKEQREIENSLQEIRSRDHKGVCQAFRGEAEQLKLLRYLRKSFTSVATYMDYYRACVDLGLDMNDTKNRYPHDFDFWHDTRIAERKSKEAEIDAAKRKALYEQYATAIAKYLSLERLNAEGYVVLIAQSPAELIKEGDALHHCVGRMGYDQKVVDGKSLIFFVRRADKQDEPFVTMEYSLLSRKVVQLYGDHNSKPEQALQTYIQKKWLPYANRQLKQIAA